MHKKNKKINVFSIEINFSMN